MAVGLGFELGFVKRREEEGRDEMATAGCGPAAAGKERRG